jgi:MFS family permease
MPPSPITPGPLVWRVAPPLLSTALSSIATGLLTLLPLRFTASGMSEGAIGLLATAEAAGFMLGCLHVHRLIAPVGQVRAYSAFAAIKAALVLVMVFSTAVLPLALLRFMLGFNAAGLAVVVESWLNALVPNHQRGRILTIYLLVIGVFYGVGQLLARRLDLTGPDLLILAGLATALALVPVAVIDVVGPPPSPPHNMQILRALRTSPASVLACLLTGLVGTAFTTLAPLYGHQVGLDQDHTIFLMVCVSVGSLLLQWPIGFLSDKVDRLHALIGLGAMVAATATILFFQASPPRFMFLAVLFIAFGGFVESLYAVGVAHANDRAVSADYVSLSSTLLLVWALGGAIGPTVGAFAMQYRGPGAFFVYALALAVPFTAFAVWRLRRRREERSTETHEDFLAYPQTSPEIYSWLPYHPPSAADAAQAERPPGEARD